MQKSLEMKTIIHISEFQCLHSKYQSNVNNDIGSVVTWRIHKTNKKIWRTKIKIWTPGYLSFILREKYINKSLLFHSQMLTIISLLSNQFKECNVPGWRCNSEYSTYIPYTNSKKKRCIQSWLFGVRLWIGVVCPGKDYFSYLQNSFISLLP